jgi:PHD/YefM family antitoxin component YafN of YafNO toxin-antitoxin module
MQTITTQELAQNFEQYQRSARFGPVAVHGDDGEPLILVSADEYRRRKRREQEALRVEELSESDLAAIAQARVPDDYAALDAELGDD